MNHIRFLVLVSLALSLSCVAGDKLFVATGRVVDSIGTPVDSCFLELHESSGRLIGTRCVSAEFEAEWVISPWPHKYYLTVICPKDSSSFKTNIFKTNWTNYAYKPLDLGTMVLKPKE